MSYYTPNSDLKILRGVSLDKSYNHTVLQTSATAQANMLASHVKYTLDKQYYQRAGKGKIRVAILADNLYDCNYLMFRNTDFGTKWFYAFIDSVEYINNNTSEISYTIDVMQTWYFDYKLGACYVEREHTLTDNIGENLVPENIDTGDLIPTNKGEFIFEKNTSQGTPMYELVVFYVPNNDKEYISGSYTETILNKTVTFYDTTPCKESTVLPGQTIPVNYYNTGLIVNGIYCGCKCWGVPLKVNNATEVQTTKIAIDNLISTILGDDVKGTIVNITQVPYSLWNYFIQHPTAAQHTFSYNQQMTTHFSNADGVTTYTPKNKKMYTYPFKCMVVTNNAGQSATYKWEYFSSLSGGLKNGTFKIMGTPIVTPELMCYPYNYRGIEHDYESGLVLTDFPEPPWSEDSFTKWWSQNGEAYVSSIIATSIVALGAIVATIASAGTAAPAGAAAVGGTATATGLTAAKAGALVATGAGVAASVAKNIGTFSTAKNTPDQLSGQAGITSLRTAQNRIGYYFYDMGVEKDIAKSIDDYFSMFGYAIKQVKVPNVRGNSAVLLRLRPSWNFIKTNGCVIHAASGKGLPSDDEDEIASIYDRGITFWQSLDYVGDYTRNNDPQ